MGREPDFVGRCPWVQMKIPLDFILQMNEFHCGNRYKQKSRLGRRDWSTQVALDQAGNSSLSFIASIMSPSVRSLPPMKACMPSVEPSTMPFMVSPSMTRVT